MKTLLLLLAFFSVSSFGFAQTKSFRLPASEYDSTTIFIGIQNVFSYDTSELKFEEISVPYGIGVSRKHGELSVSPTFIGTFVVNFKSNKGNFDVVYNSKKVPNPKTYLPIRL